MNPHEKKLVMFRLAKCMRAISSQGVIHLDLKPANTVLLEDDKIQIIDWGMAEIDKSKDQKSMKSLVKGTLWYTSPEILLYRFWGLKQASYNHKADIYSLGLIFAELFFGDPLIAGRDQEKQIFLSLSLLFGSEETTIDTPEKLKRELLHVLTDTIPDMNSKIYSSLTEKFNLEPILADLVSEMLDFNPINRIDYDEIVIHPYFQDIRREAIPKLPVFINEMPKMKVWDSKTRENLLFRIRNISSQFLQGLETMCLAFQLVDLCLEQTEKDKLLVLAIASLYLASKLFEVISIPMLDLQKQAMGLGSVPDMAETILYTLNGNILIPTVYSYYSHQKEALTRPSPEEYDRFLGVYKDPEIYRKDFPAIAREL